MTRGREIVVHVPFMNSDELVEQGDFKGALEVLRQSTSGPKVEPADLLSRFSMEVRLQQFDAAESTMQRLCAAAPEAAPVMSLLGQAARAERMATQRLSDATLATKRATVGMPPPHSVALVKMVLAHAQGDSAAAKAALAEVRTMTPATSGTAVRKNGAIVKFTNIVDSDDLTGPTLPVYEGAQLLDIAYSDIRSITLAEPKTSFDVMWPRAEVALCTGEVLRVRIPALYPGSGVSDDNFIRMGRMTTWSRDKGYAEGHGQRDLSLTTAEGGQAMVGLLTIASITFDNPMRARVAGGGAAIATADRPWTGPQKAVGWVVGILAFVLILRPGMLLSFSEDPRPAAIALGLVLCGLVGWLVSQISSKAAAAISVGITFVVTVLKWLL